MKPSTTDQIKGSFHEMKGKAKEKTGRSRITPTWRLKVKTRSSQAKSKTKSARLKRCSRSKQISPTAGSDCGRRVERVTGSLVVVQAGFSHPVFRLSQDATASLLILASLRRWLSASEANNCGRCTTVTRFGESQAIRRSCRTKRSREYLLTRRSVPYRRADNRS
jgi:uncharacterized protein YjbJ (UPF0337 family)